MSDPIVVIDSSEIREGKLEELKTALEELAAFVEANEADPIAYSLARRRRDGARTGWTVGRGRARSVKPTFEAEPNSLLSGSSESLCGGSWMPLHGLLIRRSRVRVPSLPLFAVEARFARMTTFDGITSRSEPQQAASAMSAAAAKALLWIKRHGVGAMDT